MNRFRVFFLSRALREQVMLWLLVLLGVLMWFSSFGSRAAAFWRQQRATSTELAVQSQWLANRETIEQAAEQAVSDLDPSRTFDDTRLVGELTALAREHGLRFTNDTPRTDRTADFAIHTVQFTLPRAEWGALKRFYLALSQRSPYIGIEQCSLAADRANPALLNASLRVSSVEVIR
ncbi:MAG: general secretion pathway protein GspM [Opitutus sp.]|nr:general secretion pathway protein GspM [Opitutus sp.]